MAGHQSLEIAGLGSKQRICWDLSILYVIYTFAQYIYLNTQEVNKCFFLSLEEMASTAYSSMWGI
jgi:hypothetical protein